MAGESRGPHHRVAIHDTLSARFVLQHDVAVLLQILKYLSHEHR